MSGGNWKAMFKGVQDGDFALVEYYLKMGVDPNYQHPEFLASALVESIRFDQLDITKLLLDYGANPNIKEAWAGETPLSVARVKKNEKAIELINEYLKQVRGG